MIDMQYGQSLEQLQHSLRPLREQLVKHEVYRSIETQNDLRTFMEHHVFAVWDFMSLLKALQIRLTGVTLPWTPQGDPNIRRLINEIVLEEESDEDGQGGYISHFELYRTAMAQCGADTSKIDKFVERLGRRREGFRYDYVGHHPVELDAIDRRRLYLRTRGTDPGYVQSSSGGSARPFPGAVGSSALLFGASYPAGRRSSHSHGATNACHTMRRR